MTTSDRVTAHGTVVIGVNDTLTTTPAAEANTPVSFVSSNRAVDFRLAIQPNGFPVLQGLYEVKGYNTKGFCVEVRGEWKNIPNVELDKDGNVIR